MYVHRTNNGKRISQYTCSQYTKVPCGTLCKTQHRINEDVVLSLVSEMLKAIAEYAKHDRAEFVRVVQEAQSSQQTAEVKKQRTRLALSLIHISRIIVSSRPTSTPRKWREKSAPSRRGTCGKPICAFSAE